MISHLLNLGLLLPSETCKSLFGYSSNYHRLIYMHRLSNKELNSSNVSIFDRVFLVRDSEHLKFTNEMERKVLLYPCYCYLNNPFTEDDEWIILDAIKQAAISIRDPGFYLSQLLFNEHAYVNIEEIDSLLKDTPDAMTTILEMSQSWEYRLLSSRGDWTICVSDVHHAVVAGINPFMDAFLKMIPQYETQVYDWLNTINTDITGKVNRKNFNFTYEWVRPLLVNIYGEAKTKDLLLKADLTKFLKYLS